MLNSPTNTTTPPYQLYVCINNAQLPIEHPIYTLEDATRYINYMFEKTKDIKYALVHKSSKSHAILSPTTYTPCLIEYVVHSDIVYEKSEWDNDPISTKYDDIIVCTVDINNPFFNEHTYYQDLTTMWSTGHTPIYVNRL